MTPDQGAIIVAQVRRATNLIEANLDALKPRSTTRRWPIRSNLGNGPIGNDITDTTGNTAIDWADHHDTDRLRLAYALRSLNVAALIAESVMGDIAKTARIQNPKMGIGTCDCGRYCTGNGDDRLKGANLECPACYARTRRGQRTG